MDYNFSIWLFVEVLLCGFGIPMLINYIAKQIRIRRHENNKNRGITDYQIALQDIDKQNTHYNILCRNAELRQDYFKHNVLEFEFVIPFPDTKRDLLKKHDFNPVKLYGREMKCNKELYEQMKKILTDNGIPLEEQENFIIKVAEETADKFITDIQKGRVRFNKYLYGVYNTSQISNDCIVNVYESDYFTFKTITNIYNTLKRKNGKVLFNDQYAPFLNSLGVGGFVIVNRGKGDELIWGYRGSNCQSGGYWHFSYDETFTHDDAANQDQTATFTDCIKRALDEELGVNREENVKCLPKSQITILDGGIIHTDGEDNRFEFELCSCVRICFSDSYTFDDFIQNYRFAKDAELETRCLKLVKMSELDQFITDNEDKISPEAKALAIKIKTLSDLHILGTDNEGFHELFPIVEIPHV